MNAPLIHLPEVDSTNLWAKANLDKLAPAGVVWTTCQTAGRGRLGRGWTNAAGQGLDLTSGYTAKTVQPSTLPLFSALAVQRALTTVLGPLDLKVKWPNDLILNGKKLVGILTEVSLVDGGVDYVVVGIGVNLRQRPEDFSPEVAKIATSLAAEGYDVERETLETALVDALRQAFRHLCAPETYLDDYRQLCLNLGRQVHILQTDETVTALDIDPQYGLVVRHGSGAVETLRCGEVSVRGLYGYAE